MLLKWILVACLLMVPSQKSEAQPVLIQTYSGTLIPVQGEFVRVRPVTELKQHWLFKNLLRPRTRFVIEPVHVQP